MGVRGGGWMGDGADGTERSGDNMRWGYHDGSGGIRNEEIQYTYRSFHCREIGKYEITA